MKLEAEKLRLYAVSDRSWLKEGESLAKIIEELIEAGVTCVQLREKDLSDEAFIREAKEILPVCRKAGVPLILNDRVELAKEIGADGVHVGLSDMGIEKARRVLGDGFIIGGSAHNTKEALAAQQAGADYIGCGAVFGSETKKDVSLLSREELTKICEAVAIPVVAIGGITPERARTLEGTGISGVAVVSALFAAEDKKAAAAEFLQ